MSSKTPLKKNWRKLWAASFAINWRIRTSQYILSSHSTCWLIRWFSYVDFADPFSWSRLNQLVIKTNVGKTIINHPFGNGKHTTYIKTWWWLEDGKHDIDLPKFFRPSAHYIKPLIKRGRNGEDLQQTKTSLAEDEKTLSAGTQLMAMRRGIWGKLPG
jgi:hypothetical protein